ncbi:hypothetical protein GCM10023340_26260 [Nocardioides marinquilinus]|uniref:Aminoglycoside phosphotransferase domain-containing protein n=1 Tax=Nocardioides marinquilinus TaxID=1210400 RepID=A0ABP9PPK8_9ACTN
MGATGRGEGGEVGDGGGHVSGAVTRTHDVTFTASEARKRYVSWCRGEPDREWACLTLLARHAPGVAPRPLRRETDPDGTPVVVMERLDGEPLGDRPLTAAQTAALGAVVRQTYDVPLAAVLDAGLPERLAGPTTLPRDLAAWLAEPHDLTPLRDAGLVARAVGRAREWLATPGALPRPRLTALGVSDRKPANALWDGVHCRLLDFEDSGRSDPAFELADQVEHLAGRLDDVVDPRALADAVGLAPPDRERAERYRPLWATFWLALLLPGHGGFARNPLGTTEWQAEHVLALIG